MPTASTCTAVDLLKAEVPVEKLVPVQSWDKGRTLFIDRERAALEWAEVVTRVSSTHVPEETYTEARATFSENKLADLPIAIGLMNALIAWRAVSASYRCGQPLITAGSFDCDIGILRPGTT